MKKTIILHYTQCLDTKRRKWVENLLRDRALASLPRCGLAFDVPLKFRALRKGYGHDMYEVTLHYRAVCYYYRPPKTAF